MNSEIRFVSGTKARVKAGQEYQTSANAAAVFEYLEYLPVIWDLSRMDRGIHLHFHDNHFAGRGYLYVRLPIRSPHLSVDAYFAARILIQSEPVSSELFEKIRSSLRLIH